jgi:zona occludens toxin (predicted ATPase)
MHPEVLKLHKNMEQASSEHPPPSSPASSSSSSSSTASSFTLSTSDSFTLPSDAEGDPAASSPASASSSSSSSSSSQPSFSFSSSAPPLDDVHLVVGGASGYAIVYHSIIKNGLTPFLNRTRTRAAARILG